MIRRSTSWSCAAVLLVLPSASKLPYVYKIIYVVFAQKCLQSNRIEESILVPSEPQLRYFNWFLSLFLAGLLMNTSLPHWTHWRTNLGIAIFSISYFSAVDCTICAEENYVCECSRQSGGFLRELSFGEGFTDQ